MKKEFMKVKTQSIDDLIVIILDKEAEIEQLKQTIKSIKTYALVMAKRLNRDAEYLYDIIQETNTKVKK